MRITDLSLSALILASEVSVISAKRGLFTAPPVLNTRGDATEDMLRREAWQVVDPEIGRRSPQEAASSTSTATEAAASATSTSDALNFNTPEWNEQTIIACTKAIEQVQQASNPAGMVACYNLPFLNNKTGVFSADLRLYQLTTMSGAFTGVQPNQISLSLSYPDATVSQTGSSAKVRRGVLGESVLEARQSNTTDDVQAIPGGNQNELQQFSFVGQVNKALTLTKISSTQQMALLIPTIQLSAPSPANPSSVVTSNLTAADTVYFAIGVFGGQSAAGAAAAVPTAEATAKAAAGVFVLPGTTFGIFPVGFIVTGTWTILFAAIVGYGTWGRMKFRDHYRSRVARAGSR